MSRFFLFLFCLIAPLSIQSAEPYIALYATIDQGEGAMSVCWVTPSDDSQDELAIQKKGDTERAVLRAEHKPLPTLEGFFLHKVCLKDLEPGALYAIYLKDRVRFIKAPPSSDQEPLRFVVGGDIYHDDRSIIKKMNRMICKKEPHFVVLGGDIAYAGAKYSDGKGGNPKRWLDFLRLYSETMVTKDGILIPLIAAIGNHDVDGRYGQPPEKAAAFNELFLLPGGLSYRRVDFGSTLSLYLLDTEHTHSLQEQASWLKCALGERKGAVKMAAYHVPAYPSIRKFMGALNVRMRNSIVPLFDEYGLLAAFEHHEHAYKRSYPLKGGTIDPKGTLYLGDGAFGVKKTRIPKQGGRKKWYVEKGKAKRNVFLVTIDQGRVLFEAIDEEGRVFDTVTR